MLQWIRRIGETADRMTRMARTVGADTGDALADGRLGEAGFRRALARCGQCPDTGACEDWLAGHRDGAAAAPGFCRNAAVFEALRP